MSLIFLFLHHIKDYNLLVIFQKNIHARFLEKVSKVLDCSFLVCGNQ